MKLRTDFLFGAVLGIGILLFAGFWVRTATSRSAPLPPYMEISNDGSLERTEVQVRDDLKVIFLVDWNFILVFSGPVDSYSTAMRGIKSIDVLSDFGTTEIPDASSKIYFFEKGIARRAKVPDGYAKKIWETFKGNRFENHSEAAQQVLHDVLNLGT